MQLTEHNNSIKITVPVTLDALNAHDVNTALQEGGYGRCLIIQDQITNLLVEYQQIQQKIKEKLKPEGEPLTYRIAEKRDAELSFDIAEDQMSAAAIITAAWGGAPISANALVKAAQEAGIVFGFSKDHIIKLVSHASKADSGSKVKLIIARGRAVVNGENSRFEPLIAEMQSRRNKPLVKSEDKADLRDFGVIPAVRSGEPLTVTDPNMTRFLMSLEDSVDLVLHAFEHGEQQVIVKVCHVAARARCVMRHQFLPGRPCGDIIERLFRDMPGKAIVADAVAEPG